MVNGGGGEDGGKEVVRGKSGGQGKGGGRSV